MNKRTSPLLLSILGGLLFILGCLGPANATLITYDLKTDVASPTDPTKFFEGHVTIDSANVTAGALVNSSVFVDWAFNWGDDVSWSSSSGSDTFLGGLDDILFDSSDPNVIAMWNICVGRTTFSDCSSFGTSAGEDLFRYNNVGTTIFLNVGIGEDRYIHNANRNNEPDGTWVANVPEPGTVALLGLGLLALGLLRRRKDLLGS